MSAPDRNVWTSPWRHPSWVRGVAVARGGLRSGSGTDHDLVHHLVRDQNDRVLAWLDARDAPCRDILLILPRCVKRTCCSVGRDGDLAACRNCRECALGDAARTAERLGVRAIVAFRSHLAYAAARRDRPELIIAAACEDRLVKAMASVPEIPALLSPLRPMDRMCVDAEFDRNWIARMLERAAGEVSGDGLHARTHAGP